MEKVDLKDRKILYQLDIDSRQSFSQIGKKVGLHRDVVAYRVNKLQEKGIIENFYIVIDASKLGYMSFRFYLVYQFTTPEIEKEIVDYFINNKYTWQIGSLEGRFHLGVIMWIKDINDFYSFWKETIKKYRYYFQDQVFSVYFQLFTYRHSYLLLNGYDKNDRTKLEITGGGKRVKIDDVDFQILKLIAPNARMPTTEIAEKLNSTAFTIKNRIKKLMKSGVIQGFRVRIDFSKLGYQFYKADVILINHKKRSQIINYIKSNPYLIVIDESAGYADLELEFHVESLTQFHQIMKDLSIKFPNIIQNYKYFYASKIHKWNFMPEG